MRDIVNSNDFGASTQQTKSKAKMANSSWGTLSRGDYKSYRDFLESYGDSKNSRDDQESVSSTDSGISSCKLSESKSNNTSTSSLNSEINGTSSKISQKTEQNTAFASRTGSFRNYMENYNNKKFGSVKPVVAPKQNIVKSEIVIQVNDPLDRPKRFEKKDVPVFVTTVNGDEQADDSVDALPPPLPNSLPPSRPTNGHQKEVSSVKLPPSPSQLQKNGHQRDGNFVLPSQPPQLQKNGHQLDESFVLPPPPAQLQKNSNQRDGNFVLPSPPAQLQKNCHQLDESFVLPPPHLQLQKNINQRNGNFVLPSPPVQLQKNGHQGGGSFVLPPPTSQPANGGQSDVSSFTAPSPPPQPTNGAQAEGSSFIPPPPPPKLPDFNKPHSENAGGKKWATVEVEGHCSNSNPNQPEKLATNHAAANLAKILTQHLLPRRKELDDESNVVGEEVSNKPILRPPLNEAGNGKDIFRAPPASKLPQSDQTDNKLSQNSKSCIPVVSKLPQYQKQIGQNITSPVLPPKFENSTVLKQPQKLLPPKLPPSLPPKVESSTLPRRTQKTTLEIPAPKSPQSFAKVETSTVPKQPQKIATVEPAGPKLPRTSPPRAVHGRNNSIDSVDFNTTTVVPVTDATTKVSKTDPNVRKLVYNTYRGLLGAYNNKANDMIATLPRNMVREDRGVSKQLESIAQAAAPPPPPGAVGHIPATRFKSENPGRTVEPPLCVQNAMLTKDKKPFTYTPGGIDLSEIRSPRMARRLELNAMNEGVAPLPQTQPQHPSGPLPPSALAAMQPQLPVQVFPAGGIPQPHHHGGGPPPPPPPPSGVPPPPPKAPPMKSTSPVPLDSFERPDMTKIIPENPMALLRKTSGPVIRRDPIFNKDNYGGTNRANDVVDSPPPRQPQPMKQPESPPTKTSTSGLGSIYIPPVNQNSTAPTPQKQPQSPPFANQRESPSSVARSPPAYYKRQPSTPQAEPQSPQSVLQRQPSAASSSPQRDPQTPESPKATLSKAPTPWLTQKRQQQQQNVPEWAVNDQRGQTSPVVQEQQQKSPVQQESQQVQRPWQPQQQQQQTLPWRQQQPQPQQQPQSQQQPQPQQQPQSPPWQQKQQQPEPQPWQQRQQQQQSEPQPLQQQPRQQQTPPWQQQQAQSPPIHVPQAGGVRKQVNVRERPQESGPTERTEVVIVSDPPQVFQHPGPTQRIIVRQKQPQQNNHQQQLQRADSQGVRIIPVQREGASSNGHVTSPQQQQYAHKFSSPGTPSTPGSNSDARSLNRQLSWNSNPTQSNTFRVLQKITNTDGDDDEDQPVIEHSPKTPQHFPQRQLSTEQVRKLKQSEGDQELMNKLKQEIYMNDYYEYPRYRGGQIPSKLFWMLDDSGLDQDSSLHREVDPRYRGPHIPSKAFKLLQNMTGGPEEPPVSSTVPQGQQTNNRGPKVRTIPIQIEGDGPTKTYVPPSEQTVPEPKKYMGSSIPSRSFKMLQAMTAPDDCANPAQACENNENYPNDPSSYAQWGFDPNYPSPSPYFFDPYWGYYSQHYSAPNNEFSAPNNNARMTPIPPNWGYFPQSYVHSNAPSESSDSGTEAPKKRSTSAGATPIPSNWSNDNEPVKKQNSNPRCTPVPFWPYYYPNYSYETSSCEGNQETQNADPNGNTESGEEQQNYPQYPPYWDPFYYGYYYGAPPPMYPPVYSPYPFYHPSQADTEEMSGYSSNDEMAYYGTKFVAMPSEGNARPKSAATPKSAVTPSLQKQLLQEITQAAKKMEENRRNREEKLKEEETIKVQSEPLEDDSSAGETSDSDTEMVGYEVCRQPVGGLQAIRSVSDIKVYDAEESSHCSDEEEQEEEPEVSENTTEENDDTSSVYVVDETIPHQLSVIFEESERTDSASRNVRESSVATTISEDTATIDNSEEEEEADESDGTVLVKLPLKFKFSMAESQKVATLVVGNSEVKPEATVKSENLDTRLGPTESESMENFLKEEKSIARQVSSDSYQTAENDGEIFYNTHGPNAVNESSKSNFVEAQEEAKGDESEEDIDWWGRICKDDDLLKSVTYSEKQLMPKANDILDDNNKGTPKPESGNSSSEEEDVWSNIYKGESYDEGLVVNVIQENTTESYLNIRNKESDEESLHSNECNANENEGTDVWSHMKKENSSNSTEFCKPANGADRICAEEDERRRNSNTANEAPSGNLSSESTDTVGKKDESTTSSSENENGTEGENDLTVQEGMEKVEAVLTNIISTINRRTSTSSSEGDKSEGIDFWAQILGSSEKPQNDDVSVTNIPVQEDRALKEDSDTSSACSRNSSLSSSTVSREEEDAAKGICHGRGYQNQETEAENGFPYETHVKTEEDVNDVDETEEKPTCSSNIVDHNEMFTEDFKPDPKPLSVQERIKALQESASYKHDQHQEEEADIKVSVKERISALEDDSGLLNVERPVHKRKSISRKSSIKSYEEFSEEEEEGDSGVTSDVSRHISETDTEPDFPEMRKLNKYQRAATHSRLFKLLQDECDSEDVPEDSKEESQSERTQSRREHLNLPLQKNGSDPESFSSSGFTSPGSPIVSDKLINELIQSLLRRKQGRVFKHMTMEKVKAAALRILQEDMDGLETLSSSEDGGSFLSPKKPGTGSSTPAQTPQEFYANFNEYSQYYDTWAEAQRLYEAQCDILPSKAFRLIQEHASMNKTGAVAGLLARCPRVLSNKNVQKELMKLMENHENPSPSPEPPEQPPDANEATSAS